MGKICRRCLLQDISREQYEDLIVRGLKALPEEDLTSGEENAKSLEICKKCEKLNEGTCLACGCFVEIRAALKKGVCPYKKW